MSDSPLEVWLTFAGPINNESCNRLFQGFSIVSRPTLKRAHLLIQSAGGIVGDGIAMYNFIRNLPFEVVTYNAGAIESIAVVAYLAGKVRKVSKNAFFMLHKTRTNITSATAANLRAKADSLELSDTNTEVILRALKIPEQHWHDHREGELFVSAEHAVEWELAHEYGDFTPTAGQMLLNLNSL